jgi:hypothetical protein
MALSLLMVSCAFARGDETGRDANQLKVALSLNVVTNGVATSRDGRIFMTIVRMDGSGGVALYLNRRLASEGIHELLTRALIMQHEPRVETATSYDGCYGAG